MQKHDKSKELAFLLRHDKDYAFLEHGYREVSDLIVNHNFSKDLIEELVKTDNKGRYEFNEDHSLIRARQGHSIDVDVELEEQTPPHILYHGSAERFLDSILDKGILKMSRQYVHLTESWLSAQNTGCRHGKPIVLVINSKKMSEDGIKFYKSRNNVWLAEFIDKKYILDTQTSFKKVIE